MAAALEEAEGALAQEEAKFLKLQLEHAAFKSSTEKKAGEKDEELETTRKNHQKQLAALQVRNLT